jgi:hypothetical protein
MIDGGMRPNPAMIFALSRACIHAEPKFESISLQPPAESPRTISSSAPSRSAPGQRSINLFRYVIGCSGELDGSAPTTATAALREAVHDQNLSSRCSSP